MDEPLVDYSFREYLRNRINEIEDEIEDETMTLIDDIVKTLRENSATDHEPYRNGTLFEVHLDKPTTGIPTDIIVAKSESRKPEPPSITDIQTAIGSAKPDAIERNSGYSNEFNASSLRHTFSTWGYPARRTETEPKYSSWDNSWTSASVGSVFIDPATGKTYVSVSQDASTFANEGKYHSEATGEYAEPLLSIELVPSTCWWSNVRSNIPKSQWQKCKKFVQDRSGKRCEICGGKGRRWPVECHEIWFYDDVALTQTLVDLIALCPDCHQVKHFGRTREIGKEEQALKHLISVNGWSEQTARDYVEWAFRLWSSRSLSSWTLNVDFLSLIGVEVPETLDRQKDFES